LGRHACHLVFSIMLATSSARQADGQRGWQFPSFAGEQAQRGLSLVAVFGYNVPVKRPLLLEPVIALFARQHAQLGECAGAGDGRGRPEIGRQIELIGAPSTASRPAGTGAHIKADRAPPHGPPAAANRADCALLSRPCAAQAGEYCAGGACAPVRRLVNGNAEVEFPR